MVALVENSKIAGMTVHVLVIAWEPAGRSRVILQATCTSVYSHLYDRKFRRLLRETKINPKPSQVADNKKAGLKIQIRYQIYNIFERMDHKHLCYRFEEQNPEDVQIQM